MSQNRVGEYMVTDPIADLLTRIRNANKNYQDKVSVPHSQLKWNIVRLFQEEGFIKHCEITEENNRKTIILTLKYAGKRNRVISNLKRVSKPGRRVYSAYNDLKKYRRGLGVTVISSPKGILTERAAFAQKVGGEIVCTVW